MSSEDGEDYDRDGAYYEIEDPDEPEENRREPKEPKNVGIVKYLKLLIKILISPRVGWKEVRRLRINGDEACRNLFYPMVGLAACANFMNLAFDPERTVTQEVVNALLTFASFFFGYFLVFPFARLLLKGEGAEVVSTGFGKSFVAFSMSTLALFYILYCLLPMLEPIVVMLPLWTIFAITRGIKMLRIPEEDQTSATVWLSLLIVGLPIGVGYIFSIIMPY